MVGASIVAAVTVVGFSLVTRMLVGAIIIQILWNVALGSGSVSLTAVVSELSPENRSTLLSLNSAAIYLGATAATATGSVLLATGGFIRLGIVCGTVSLAVGFIARYFAREIFCHGLRHQSQKATQTHK